MPLMAPRRVPERTWDLDRRARNVVLECVLVVCCGWFLSESQTIDPRAEYHALG